MSLSSGFVPLPNGARIAYEVMGRGAPLLLLCSLCGPMPLWGSFREQLSRRFCTIALDPRGVGRSSPAAFPTTTRSMAEEVSLVLRHLGFSSVDVFGISLGGMVATRLALDAPEHVSKLVLASTPPSLSFFAPRALLRALKMATYLPKPAQEALILMTREIVSEDFARAHPEDMTQAEAAFSQTSTSRRDLLLQLSAAATHNTKQELGRLHAPTLVLAGDQDKLLSLSGARFLQKKMPNARLLVLEGAGHDLVLERATETAHYVSEFFSPG